MIRAGRLIASVVRRLRYAVSPNVRVTSAPPGIRIDWNVAVKVRDGTTLRVNVFRPATSSAVPVIMCAHPYGKDRIPAKTRNGRGVSVQYRIMPQPKTVRFSELTSWEAPDPAFWVTRGYAVVNADLRGGGTSEGTGDLFSDQEALDYYDLIEWSAVQPWSTGRVGLDGVSYLAISQYKVAALRPPHLAAICPWEGLSDFYRDFARPGGTREDGFTILWGNATRRVARMHTNVRRELVARTERDAWYESLTPTLERIDVPMLVCASFSDQSLHTRGSFEVFRRAGSSLKTVYTHRNGKWCEYYSDVASATRERFFDHTLKELDNGWPSEPAVRLTIHDSGSEPIAIVGESDWPPHDLNWSNLALDARARSLVREQPVEVGSLSLQLPRDVARFTWKVPEDCDVIGPMKLRIHVELRGAPDARLFVGARKLRGGHEMTFEGSFGFSGDMVSKGWQRLAHRTLDERLTTPFQPVHRHDAPEAFQAGEVVAVQIALLPHATRFRKGDTLQLDIRGDWHYPRDPFRGQFPTGYQRSPKATLVIYTGGSYDTQLLLGRRPCALAPA